MKSEKYLIKATITYFLNVRTTFLGYFYRLMASNILIHIKEVLDWKVWEPNPCYGITKSCPLKSSNL
jgi:hypothetical protein